MEGEVKLRLQFLVIRNRTDQLVYPVVYMQGGDADNCKSY